MRDAFHDDLDKITDQLVEMSRLAGSVAQRVVYLVTGEYRSELDLPELDHEEQEDSRVAL